MGSSGVLTSTFPMSQKGTVHLLRESTSLLVVRAFSSTQTKSLQCGLLPFGAGHCLISLLPQQSCGSSASVLKWKILLIPFYAALRFTWCKSGNSCGLPWVVREQMCYLTSINKSHTCIKIFGAF